MYSRMLVTLDRSKASETILNHIERAAGPETQITLLTVAEVSPSLSLSGPALLRHRQARAVDEETRYLEKMAEPLRERGLHVDTQVALGDCEGPWATASVAGSSGRVSAAEEILKAANKLGADVIVMSTHGHGALAKAVFGSVTEHVLRTGLCPVLLVRPDRLK